MQKTIIEPLEDRPFARAVVIEEATHKRVFVSGAAAIDEDGSILGHGDIGAQTRHTMNQIQSYLSRVDGTLEDIVRVRVYVNDDLTDETYNAINDARAAAFPEVDRFPASSVVGVDGLILDELLIEIEAEAIIPENSWETSVID